MTKFKVGDVVRCVETAKIFPFVGVVGEVYLVQEVDSKGVTIKDIRGNSFERFELVSRADVQYEDKWHLNDGSKEVPDDAEKLYNPEGTSVVAYRLVKKPVVREFVRYTSSKTEYRSSPNEATYHTHKITYVEVDGELTEVLWEKV